MKTKKLYYRTYRKNQNPASTNDDALVHAAAEGTSASRSKYKGEEYKPRFVSPLSMAVHRS